MSYILDALRKRQVESDPDAAMTLAMMQAQHAEAAQHRQTRALWAVGAALLVNAGLLGWWLTRPDPRPTEPAATAVVPATPAESASGNAPLRPPVGDPIVHDPVARDVRDPIPREIASEPGSVSADHDPGGRAPARSAGEPQGSVFAARPDSASHAAPSGGIGGIGGVLRSVDLNGLSDAERQAMGPLEFSSHVFGDLSWVVLNGKRLEAGDRFGDLRLHAITEDGVEVEFRDYLVSISVVDLWGG